MADPKERIERVFETEGRFGGSWIDSLAVGVGESRMSFGDETGVVGALDKGDGDEMNIELSTSSLRRDKADALRLREVVATAGRLALAACDDGAGVNGAGLACLGLGGFLSGDEELPLSGEERCFPVAL